RRPHRQPQGLRGHRREGARKVRDDQHCLQTRQGGGAREAVQPQVLLRVQRPQREG
ncbi:unnamed protein product, partial [Phaeothamnion confervicola]